MLPAVHGKEHARTKKLASNGLALQLVTQLYHLGVIEAHKPGEKKTNQVTMVIVTWLKYYWLDDFTVSERLAIICRTRDVAKFCKS